MLANRGKDSTCPKENRKTMREGRKMAIIAEWGEEGVEPILTTEKKRSLPLFSCSLGKDEGKEGTPVRINLSVVFNNL
jgi:hypothetical protein